MYTRAPTYRNDVCHCSTGIGFISSSSNGFSITISKCLHFETYLPYPSDGSNAHLQIQKNTKNKKNKNKKKQVHCLVTLMLRGREEGFGFLCKSQIPQKSLLTQISFWKLKFGNNRGAPQELSSSTEASLWFPQPVIALLGSNALGHLQCL